MRRNYLNAFIFALICVGCGFNPPQPGQMPNNAPPMVVLGADVLSSRAFASVPVGTVTDLRYDARDGTILAAGTGGGCVIGRDGVVRRSVRIGNVIQTDRLMVVPGTPTHYLESGSWSSPARLFGPDGRQLWQSESLEGVDDAAAGPIGNVRPFAVTVGYNGGSGISLLSPAGRVLWNRSDANVWEVAITDAPPDRARIVHSNAAGSLTIRDATGRTLKSSAIPGCYLSYFTLCRWPKATGPQVVMASTGQHIWVIDLDGKVIGRYSAPLSTADEDRIVATPVAFRGRKDVYLAVLTYPLTGLADSALYVYDASGRPVYAASLAPGDEALGTVPNGSGGETLLVGGAGGVRAYVPRPMGLSGVNVALR